jgi:hypothetical protein
MTRTANVPHLILFKIQTPACLLWGKILSLGELVLRRCVVETVPESPHFEACGCECMTFPLSNYGGSAICQAYIGGWGVPVYWRSCPFDFHLISSGRGLLQGRLGEPLIFPQPLEEAPLRVGAGFIFSVGLETA